MNSPIAAEVGRFSRYWTRVSSSFRIAAAILLGVLIITHGVPAAMGLSFWPLPTGLYAESGPVNSAKMPAYLTGVDNFSFPHVEWPWRNTERNFIAAGEFPLWDPYASLGLPFAPQYENQLFLPLEWMEIFGGPHLWDAFLLLKIFLAGVGVMLLVRRFCSTPPALLAAGLSYAYSGYFLWFNTIPGFVNGAAGTPWLFLAIAALFSTQTSALRRTGQLALTVGFIWLCGQPQISAISSLTAAALFFWCWIGATGQRGTTLVLAITGTGLGFLIAVPQLWSFVDALERGYSIHLAGSYSDYGTSPLNFILSIWPFLFGQLMAPWASQLYPERLNWEAFPLVVGSSGFLLSILGLVILASPPKEGKRPVLLSAIVAVGLLSLFVIIAESVGWSFRKPPGFDRINFPRYVGPVLSLCVASLSAWAVENLRYASLRQLTTPPTLLLISALVTTAAFSSIAKANFSRSDLNYLYSSLVLGVTPSVLVLLSWYAIVFASVKHKIEAKGAAWAVVIVAAGELIFFVRLGFNITSELLRLIPLGLVCACAIALAFRYTRAAAAALVAALTGSVAILVFAQHRLAPVRDPYLDPPRYITFLQSIAGWREGAPRILTTQFLMMPNVGNAFELSGLTSLNPLQIDRTARLIFDLLGTTKLDYTIPNAWIGMGARPGPGYLSWPDYFDRRRFYNALAVTYLIDTPTGSLSDDSSVELVYRDTKVAVYRDHHAMPRAYAIDAVRVVDSFDEAISAMREPEFDPHTQAVIEAPSMALPPTIAGNSRGSMSPLSITHLGSTRVDVNLAGTNHGLAVLADAYDPGWKAEVDGEPRSIYPVNGALRGVVIGPGDKLLTFHFSPQGFPVSLVLALLAFCFSVAFLLPWRRSHKHCLDTRIAPQ